MKKAYVESKTDMEKMTNTERCNLKRKWRKNISRTINENYLSKFPDYNPAYLSDLHEIEKKFRCRIHLWGKRSNRGEYKCLRQSPFMEPSTYDFHVDFILPDATLELTLKNSGVILNMDDTIPYEIREKPKTWRLFEAVAIQKNPELKQNLSGLRSTVKKLETEWSRSVFEISAV